VPFCEPSYRPELVSVEPEAKVTLAFWLRRELGESLARSSAEYYSYR